MQGIIPQTMFVTTQSSTSNAYQDNNTQVYLYSHEQYEGYMSTIPHYHIYSL